MKWIKAEGVEFKYIFPNDKNFTEVEFLFKTKIIDSYYNMPLLRDNDLPDELYKIIQNGNNTRLAIFKRPQFPKNQKENITFYDAPYCIVWPNYDIDLNVLDQKVINDTFNDQDFINSIKTYIQRVVCFTCHQEYVSLVIDPGAIYIILDKSGKPDSSKLDLLEKKLHRVNLKKCPNCSSSFTIYVAKILYKCEDKKFTW
ncbi:hypothetical protein [Gilliamella intestini]|uniref:Uncharacterized protein n=1 Tax=Gilliamella intestini TaxID=1798183 RepID=A0A1C4DSL9_9GAMM|nr:hypothetical protein [Gilliamella intestini]SCC34349.1 hypothetical protein GA0061080_11031 [Gilliamella intestini]